MLAKKASKKMGKLQFERAFIVKLEFDFYHLFIKKTLLLSGVECATPE
jgi:hypothetical protein